jgi:hypothetical protein
MLARKRKKMPIATCHLSRSRVREKSLTSSANMIRWSTGVSSRRETTNTSRKTRGR